MHKKLWKWEKHQARSHISTILFIKKGCLNFHVLVSSHISHNYASFPTCLNYCAVNGWYIDWCLLTNTFYIPMCIEYETVWFAVGSLLIFYLCPQYIISFNVCTINVFFLEYLFRKFSCLKFCSWLLAIISDWSSIYFNL